jgi:hypothetical protein
MGRRPRRRAGRDVHQIAVLGAGDVWNQRRVAERAELRQQRRAEQHAAAEAFATSVERGWEAHAVSRR